ncbi:MAG: Eco57I restriction-modification methylase domain-containing protein, partial [Bacteroidia bacterium]|nr:Eco57I restriction-modification methylase domain-containing protein [Bacteroidia bacterium]
VYNKITDIEEANRLVNSLRICDPAVGSGHFLVSALNEIIAIKSKLGILADKEGKRLKDYTIEVINDELVITGPDGEFFEYNPKNKESKRVQETLFREKQIIIENCLFGVDINPNSVKICRLRLWIELLKNAYYKPGTRNPEPGIRNQELETLPNIDINIKCGNSLISRYPLDADIGRALKSARWNVDNYREAVMTYRNAPTKEVKRNMEELIEKIKGQFETEVAQNDKRFQKLNKLKGELDTLTGQGVLFDKSKKEKDDWNRKVTKASDEMHKLEAEIAEIKSNKVYENAFEWRFEFPEVLDDNGNFRGFDVVIGNPPYIRQELLGTLKGRLESEYAVFKGTADILVYFFERGLNLLIHEGIICLISSNKFIRANYGSNLRKYLTRFQIDKIIDFGELPVFEEAATFPAIFLIKKKSNFRPTHFTQIKTLDFSSLDSVIEKNVIITELTSMTERWTLASNSTKILLEKLKHDSITLKEYVKKEMFRGILTGFNEAFVIDKNKKDELIKIDPKSSEIIFPFLIGDDVRKFYIKKKDRFLIFARHGIEIERYQTIKSHLEQFKKNLQPGALGGRKPGKYKWYEIQDATSYFEKLLKPKIIYPEIAKESRFTYDIGSSLLNKTCFFISTEDLGLLGLLNSTTIWFYLKQICSVLGDQDKGGRLMLQTIYVETIPLPKNLPLIISKIEFIVKDILLKKNHNPNSDTSALESEIDRLVYELYGLTEEEIRIVEGATA